MNEHRLKVHLLVSFVYLPVLMGLFFVPGVNIPLIYFFALVTLPFSFVMGFFAPDGFEKHFDSALIMVYPTDVIGWFFFGAYLLIFFNFYTFIYLRQSASRT